MGNQIDQVFDPTGRISVDQAEKGIPTQGRLLIASCRSGIDLAGRTFKQLQDQIGSRDPNGAVDFLENIDDRFSDTETRVRLEKDVSGYDVFLFQSLLDPLSNRTIDENYMAFLIAARAFRDWGAARITGVLPYLAYARQDKPTFGQRETATAKLMADLATEAGIQRLVTWHPHKAHIQDFYERIPVIKLDSQTLFYTVFKAFSGRPEVILIAPDTGAAKYVTRLGRALNLHCAVTSKYRPQPEVSEISEIIGDFSGKRVAIVVDDMISSGGTVYNLIKKIASEYGIEEVHLGASHNLGLQSAYKRLSELHSDYRLQEAVVTNSVPQKEAFTALPFFKVWDLSRVFAQVIDRLHHNQPVQDLLEIKP